MDAHLRRQKDVSSSDMTCHRPQLDPSLVWSCEARVRDFQPSKCVTILKPCSHGTYKDSLFQETFTEQMRTALRAGLDLPPLQTNVSDQRPARPDAYRRPDLTPKESLSVGLTQYRCHPISKTSYLLSATHPPCPVRHPSSALGDGRLQRAVTPAVLVTTNRRDGARSMRYGKSLQQNDTTEHRTRTPINLGHLGNNEDEENTGRGESDALRKAHFTPTPVSLSLSLPPSPDTPPVTDCFSKPSSKPSSADDRILPSFHASHPRSPSHPIPVGRYALRCLRDRSTSQATAAGGTSGGVDDLEALPGTVDERSEPSTGHA
ncbi:hypothetical protein Cob_v002763 [Colletotrichum orbiculare MAFF 240422]|uniref:Uncharacterized protein n=1 Tax=Colletotrichum orbiculare (strain 104-T / ATCC 96160 / CBS 514.97 / LARS 414 / MAFF 240422) TaxID=1213857 RepID=A0A484G1J3_COLOR|nr:hypothetical protein Cob_v002763 [Colletotrichum orbiculare MAFF 240422]